MVKWTRTRWRRTCAAPDRRRITSYSSSFVSSFFFFILYSLLWPAVAVFPAASRALWGSFGCGGSCSSCSSDRCPTPERRWWWKRYSYFERCSATAKIMGRHRVVVAGGTGVPAPSSNQPRCSRQRWSKSNRRTYVTPMVCFGCRRMRMRITRCGQQQRQRVLYYNCRRDPMIPKRCDPTIEPCAFSRCRCHDFEHKTRMR